MDRPTSQHNAQDQRDFLQQQSRESPRTQINLKRPEAQQKDLAAKRFRTRNEVT